MSENLVIPKTRVVYVIYMGKPTASRFLQLSNLLVHGVVFSFILLVFNLDCMKPLIKSEDFHLRNIQVSSMHYEFGDPVRVGLFHPWCSSAGKQFGEWVQVDLGKLFN